MIHVHVEVVLNTSNVVVEQNNLDRVGLIQSMRPFLEVLDESIRRIL